MIKNDLESLQPQINELNGIYRGVVENNIDPDKEGKAQIRIFGVHSPNKRGNFDGIPTEELPWAQPALSLFEGSISGYGAWTIPVQGSHVYCFFENGHPLEPRYFASIPGVSSDKNYGFDENQGFCDPDKNYPVDHRLNEPDVHRLARGISNETLVQNKEENLATGITSVRGETWDEPSPGYNETNEKYPNNNVFATRTGITIEIDNTPENPRLHIYHPSNTYYEINSNGDLIISNGGDRFQITKSNHNMYTALDKNETIGKDYGRRTNGNETIEVGGDKEENIEGKKTFTVEGTTQHTSKGNYTIQSNKILDLKANSINISNAGGSGSCSMNTTSLTIETSDGCEFTTDITINGDLTVNGNANITGDLTVGGLIYGTLA